MEPHNPYDPPDAFLDRVLDGRARPDVTETNRAMNLSNLLPFSDDMVQAVEDLYDAEVISLDARLRELFAALQSRGFLDRAIVAIVADHGEEFREHGLMGHHQTLYEQAIRVPLILLVPGHGERVDITSIVSLTDVAPTVLDLAGVPVPASFEGRSLRTAMRISETWWPRAGAAAGRRTPVAFSELILEGDEDTARNRPHERAVITSARKLILGNKGEREFYDLHADPGETDPRGLGEVQRRELDAAITQLGQLAGAAAMPGSVATPDAETRERMRALGYAQ